MHVKQTHWLVICIQPPPKAPPKQSTLRKAFWRQKGLPHFLLHLAMAWGQTMSNLALQLSPCRPPFAAAGTVVPSSNSTCTWARKENSRHHLQHVKPSAWVPLQARSGELCRHTLSRIC